MKDKELLLALDWNGTLFDDLMPHVKAANEFLAFFGRPSMDCTLYQETFEVPIDNYAKKHGCDMDLFKREGKSLAIKFHKAVDLYSEDCTLRTGTAAFLEWATKPTQGMKPMIVSNHIKPLIDKELDRHGIASYFNKGNVIANLASHEIHHTRGKGQKLFDYIQEKSIDGRHVVVMGDTAEEADIARMVGGKSILITGGYNSERRLRAAQPDFVVHTFEEAKLCLMEMAA